jgi:hypothetical protein
VSHHFASSSPFRDYPPASGWASRPVALLADLTLSLYFLSSPERKTTNKLRWF